ncbi:hypothetical protein OIE66_30830 [Nonomuraea sp. NBC_01738]|uniref:hypothetical protein n=1 Tax=Nonomuraea sp. NBC_01738 TaxID=2976003 RepID=UPI002E0F0384|nr:hypothetical protein OIE66_30830 [Nonomuraea sp. NBC_01738]
MRIRFGVGCLVTVLLALGAAGALLTAGATWQAAATFGIYAIAVLVIVGVLYVRSMIKIADQLVVAFTDPDKLMEQAIELSRHGMVREAEQTQLQAIRLLEGAGPERRADLAGAHHWLGKLFTMREWSSPGPALEHAGTAAEMLRALVGEGDTEQRLLLANALFTKGHALLSLRREEEALVALTEAAGILRTLRPDDPSASTGLSAVLVLTTDALARLGRDAEAAEAEAEAEEVRRQASA